MSMISQFTIANRICLQLDRLGIVQACTLLLLWRFAGRRCCRVLQVGFNYYKSGQWIEARSMLEQTYTMRSDLQGHIVRDQPSKVLMDFMALTHFVAPGDWTGSRNLAEK
jgi:hypothetical protein